MGLTPFLFLQMNGKLSYQKLFFGKFSFLVMNEDLVLITYFLVMNYSELIF